MGVRVIRVLEYEYMNEAVAADDMSRWTLSFYAPNKRMRSATMPFDVIEWSGESDPNLLDMMCSLCHVKMSTGPCHHLLELDDGRIGLPRVEWESLIEDRLRLREMEREGEGG
jgi:hypothetical protein